MSDNKLQGNTSNFNQALWLAISSFSSMLLALGSAAILSRYFDKSEYGTYKQVMYVYATLQIVFTAGLPGVFSYFIPRLSIGQSKLLVNRITLLLGAFGASFSFVLYFGAGLIASILNNPELENGLKIFAVVPFFTFPSMGVEGIYTAIRKTKYIAIFSVVNKLTTLLFVLIPVLFFGGSYKSALIGWSVAHFLIFLYSMYMKSQPFKACAIESLPELYKKVFSYSMPLMGVTIIGMFVNSSNQFYISRYYGEEVFAEFSNGYITIPFIGIIANSIKSVLMPILSRENHQGNITNALSVYHNAITNAVVLIYPLIVFCLFFSGDIMTFLYGEQYLKSKSYFQVSLIRDFFLIFPFHVVLLATGHSFFYFCNYLFLAILVWGAGFWVVSLNLSPIYIAISFTISQICFLLIFVVYIYMKIGISLVRKRVFGSIIKVLMHSFVVSLIVFLLSYYMLNDFIAFYRLIICGLTTFFLLISSGKVIQIDYLTAFKRLRTRTR